MKLEIDKVQFKNFLSYGKIPQTIEFKPGINLILGNDLAKDRSNGTGKSSAAETIAFALYGKVNKDVRKSSVINWKNKKNCEVILDFHKGGAKYSFVRALKPDLFEVYKNGRLMPVPSHKIDYQKQIEDEIIGMDFKTFASLIYSNLNSSPPILSMNTNKKREFMENVFGLQLFALLNNKCNEKLKTMSDKMVSLKTGKSFMDKNVTDIRSQVVSLQQRMLGLVSYDTDLEEAKKKLKELKESKITKQTDILLEKVEKKGKKVKDLTNKLAEYKAELAVINREIQYIDNHLAMFKGDLASELASILAKYISHEKIEDDRVTTSDKIHQSKVKYESLEGKYKDISKHMIEMLAFMKASSSNLDILMGVTSCPTCGQEVSGELKDKIKLENEQYSRDYAKSEKEKTKLNKEIKEMAKSISALEGSLTELNLAASKLDTLKKQIQEKEELLTEKGKKENLRTKTTERIQQASLDIENLGDEIKEIEKSLIESREHEERIRKVETNINIIKEKAKQQEITRKELASLISEYEGKIEEIEKDRRKNTVDINKLNSISDYLDFIKILCRDDQAKSYAISSIIPYLNKRVNHYLSEVGHSFYMILDNWLDEDIRGPGITGCSYGSLSGGEARACDISLQMALLDIARIQAGVFPDVLLLDEILDSSMDSYSLEKIMQIIRLKQREDQSKIFIVSHRKEVQDFLADNVFLVTKNRDGFSYISPA